MTQRTERSQAKLTARDRALIAETIGFLLGVAVAYNEDDLQYRTAEVLAARLKNLREKVWPVDG